MTEPDRLLLKFLSLLLQYPDTGLKSALASLEELAGELPEASSSQICRRFLPYLKATPLLRIQEEYTQTFDLNPAGCLYLTYHRWGNDRKRGGALAGLHQTYHDCGYESTSGELPDYLPLVLEFASASPGDKGFEVLHQFSSEIEKLDTHLRERRSPYADLLGVLVEAVAERAPADKRRDDDLE